MSRCKICRNPHLGAVDSLLASGLKLKDIAAQLHGISIYSLSRHRRNCLTTSPEVSGGAEELAKWMQRADDLYLIAGSNADVRGQLGALTAAFKGVVASEKQRDKDRDQQEIDNMQPHPATVQELDIRVKAFLESCNDTICFRCGAPITRGRYLDPVAHTESPQKQALKEIYS